MFCKNCGNKIADDSLFCPSCGTQQRESQQTQPPPSQPAPPVNGPSQQQKPGVAPDDAPSGAFGFLCFLFPVVGLILFLIWHKEYPQKAKSCGIGAIISACLYVVIYIVAIAGQCASFMEHLSVLPLL